MRANALQPETIAVYPSAPVREVAWHEGDVVRKLRISAGLRLEDLAELASMSFTTIAALELGKTRDPKKATIEKIALAFGLTERELRSMVPQQTVRLKQSVQRKSVDQKRVASR